MFPEEVLNAVKAASKKHPGDISQAIDMAVKTITKLPNYSEFVNSLVHRAIQELVYQQRHIENTNTKKNNGSYGGTPKVNAGESHTVGKVFESVFNYKIAGTILGMVKGEDLEGIASEEEAIANGHLFNSRLCKKLSSLVPKGKMVKEAVSEKKLQSLFREIQKKLEEAA